MDCVISARFGAYDACDASSGGNRLMDLTSGGHSNKAQTSRSMIGRGCSCTHTMQCMPSQTKAVTMLDRVAATREALHKTALCGSPVLAVAVLGRQALHELVHEVAVVHGEAAVDRVQRVRHAQGVHLTQQSHAARPMSVWMHGLRW